MSRDRTAPQLAGQEGMTLIEVMVAVVVLLIGVLGLLAMVETSLSSTSRTTAREQGTNLARELVERSREVPYAQMTASAAAGALAAKLPEAPAASATSFGLTRRNVAYAVDVDACSIDDPADGAGSGDASFCDAPTGAGSAGPGTRKVLGYNVAWTGDPITALCTVITSNGSIAALVSNVLGGNLLGLAQGGARVAPCADPSKSVAYDESPSDLRRVKIRVTWERGGGGAVTQTTLLASPR